MTESPRECRQWRAAYLRPVREWPMRWVLRDARAGRIEKALRSLPSRPWSVSDVLPGRGPEAPPQVCLGLFAAAELLGLGLVHGVTPHLYIEQRRPEVLQRLGLMQVDAGDPPDVFVRLPLAPQSVFRGAILRHGVSAADVLQVWLDVAEHPSRGGAQAQHLERGALRSLFGRRK